MTNTGHGTKAVGMEVNAIIIKRQLRDCEMFVMPSCIICDCAVTLLGYDCIRINRVHDGSNSWSVLQRGELMIFG